MDTKRIQNGNKLDTQYSIDKNSIDKNSKEYIVQKQEENQEQIQEQNRCISYQTKKRKTHPLASVLPMK